jgi:hypothetical protein
VTGRTARSELTRLADKAVEHGDGHTVAVIRGFGRGSRQRAAELRRKLERRGVTAIDITPLALTFRHSDRAAARTLLDSGAIGLLVDAGPDSSHAPNLAAELGVPLLHSRSVPGPARHSVIGVFLADTLIAAGLHRVEFRPLDAHDCRLKLQSGTSPWVHAAGAVTVHLEHPEIGRTDRMILQPSAQALTADTELTVASHWGPTRWSLMTGPLRH